VAHTCNPSCSGGRDQEDYDLKPAQASSSVSPYLEKPFTKIELVEWLKVKALSSSPSTAKRKKKDIKKHTKTLTLLIPGKQLCIFSLYLCVFFQLFQKISYIFVLIKT
jgi:hypothetical protein